MHAALVLLLWLVAVVVIQALPGPALLVAVAASIGVAGVIARPRALRLMRRVRFLLLAIVVLFAGFTPGEALVADWPLLSPTREGVALALIHAGRLLAVVAAVAVLLEVLPAARLVGGLHVLCGPLRWIGVPPERVAVRLLLVLRYVETTPRGSGKSWHAWLVEEDSAAEERMLLQREQWRARDAAVLLTVALGLGLWVSGVVW